MCGSFFLYFEKGCAALKKVIIILCVVVAVAAAVVACVYIFADDEPEPAQTLSLIHI